MEAIAFKPGPQLTGTEVIDLNGVHWTVLKNIGYASAQPREGIYYTKIILPIEYNLTIDLAAVFTALQNQASLKIMATSTSANINVQFNSPGIKTGVLKVTANGKTVEKVITLDIKPAPVPVAPAGIFGYAAVGGTTGGAGGTVVTVKTYAELKKAATSPDPMIIYVEGELKGTSSTANFGFYGTGNKTIIGKPGATINGFGMWWDGFTTPKHNVIIRNLKFRNMPIFSTTTSANNRDYLTFKNGVTKVWVDKCEFETTQGIDGLLDTGGGCNFITISHCRFPKEDKAVLMGGADMAELGLQKATMAYNYFLDCTERQPSFSLGKLHFFNNLTEGITANFPAGYGCSARRGAIIRTDNNVHKNFKGHPFRIQRDLDTDGVSYIMPFGQFSGLETNININSGTNQLYDQPASDWVPTEYDYSGFLLPAIETENYVYAQAKANLTLADIGL